MNIQLGKTCGSCLNSNRPKQPRDHAAHYEVAKTERWCFKHNCHITRECVCNDYEGTNRSAKISFTRILKFNKRIETVKEILELIGDKEIKIGYHSYKKIDNWLSYKSDFIYSSYDKVRTKSSSHDKDFIKILEQLKG